MTDPGQFPGQNGTGTATTGTTDYLGNAQDPTFRAPLPGGVHLPFGVSTYQAPGYKKGDQVALLPTDGPSLAALQAALVQAGYISDAQAKLLVLGSPDEITTTAYAKLLATANLSGVDWKTALATRLAFRGSPAPEVKKVPPLTIALTNPEDIKTTLQNAAQTLYGGNLPDDVVNRFTNQFQAQERQAQTQAYYQQYNPTEGGYGPGGETTAAPSLDANNIADFIRHDPQTVDQYKATQFGSMVTDALSSLRSSGYLPTNSAPA